MDDERIVDEYWARSENAIRETDLKYGKLLRSLSYGILTSHEDAEECTNDTYLAAWNAMPTDRPSLLGAYLSKIVRRISIDRFRHDHRQKRGGPGADTLVDELTDCIPDSAPTPAEALEGRRLSEIIDAFLAGLPGEKRVLFVNRYFYAVSVAALAERSGMTQANVKIQLYRMRGQLKELLEKEGLM